jgi:hypothetical protein
MIQHTVGLSPRTGWLKQKQKKSHYSSGWSQFTSLQDQQLTVPGTASAAAGTTVSNGFICHNNTNTLFYPTNCIAAALRSFNIKASMAPLITIPCCELRSMHFLIKVWQSM